MRPAICKVCNISAVQSPNGEWVTFLDYKSLDEEEIGHPDGLEWFCENHIEAAKLLSHKNYSDALQELQKKYPVAISNTIEKNENKKWWQQFIKH
ncbi:MAG TPA: hypothetical protein EYQ43_11160 [Methyloprofundus sp.]|nr:hypothetical protein [Methyloprofundus sp.]